MKTITPQELTTLDALLRRNDYDPGSPAGLGPKMCAAMGQFGADFADGDVAVATDPLPGSPLTHPDSYFEGIIDVNHHNPYTLSDLKARGVAAIVHKASEWKADDLYASRKAAALVAGFEWGAYHFSTDEDGKAQADRFLSVEDGKNPRVLLCLDWENTSVTERANMDAANARKFVLRIREKTGRLPLIYGSNLPHENLPADKGDVLWQCPLWIARLSTQPPTWAEWVLWQYADDSLTNPSGAGLDWNRFRGTEADLRAAWPFTRAA